MLINIIIDDDVHNRLTFKEAEQLLTPYKEKHENMKPRQKIKIKNASMYFDCDKNKNRFLIETYKTSQNDDKWILFMKDSLEGYALYQNPLTKEYELAWYHQNLDKPLSPEEEQSLITCYIPKIINLK